MRFILNPIRRLTAIKIEPKHFENWVEWAKKGQIGLDFNPSCFSHTLSEDGMTLSHPDAKVRQFWIDHCKASRRVSEYFGKELGTPSIMNIWVPDGMKDMPAESPSTTSTSNGIS